MMDMTSIEAMCAVPYVPIEWILVNVHMGCGEGRGLRILKWSKSNVCMNTHSLELPNGLDFGRSFLSFLKHAC